VLSRLFCRLFLEKLLNAFDAGKLEFFSSLESLREPSSFLDYLAPLREAEWVVYAKRPFAGPEQVLDYVGRYTHRVAISNNRLLDIAEGKVTFRYLALSGSALYPRISRAPENGSAAVRSGGCVPLLRHRLSSGAWRVDVYGAAPCHERNRGLPDCCSGWSSRAV
jgi:Putative transposase